MCITFVLRFDWRQVASGRVYFAENKFCLKCGNCSVQVDGVLMIYCVLTEHFSAYFD